MNHKQWVAIIDDDASLRTSLARLLRCHSILAETFGSAEEYLEREPDGEPRCIVLDVQLNGGLNGFDLQERLESEGAAPPIIFMTGHMGFFPLERQSGPIDYLRKPFDATVLIERVHQHLMA